MFIKNKEIGEEFPAEGLSRKILAHGGKMMMVEVRFKKGARGRVHSHPHEQVSYIISGSFEVETDGEKELLSAGDSFYVPPDIPHGVLALEDAVILDVFTPQREDFLP